MSEHLLDGTKLDASWATLDRYASKVDEQIDLLVNYTAGDGFLYRQSSRATVARDINLNVAGTILALLLSAVVAWALARRIVGPVAVASNVAELHRHGQARRRDSERARRRARRACSRRWELCATTSGR